jgi:hypothetical protein
MDEVSVNSETSLEVIEKDLIADYTKPHESEQFHWGESEGESRRNQDLGFAPRPLVLCNLPHSKPKGDLWERHNGYYKFEVVGHPKYGIPYGKDKYIVYWVITEVLRTKNRKIVFKKVSHMLNVLGIKSKGGQQYKTFQERLERIFSSTMFFQSSKKSRKADFFIEHNFLEDDGEEKYVVLSEALFKEIMNFGGAIPLDFAILRELGAKVSAVDLYIFTLWRTFRIKVDGLSQVSIPLVEFKEHSGMSPNRPVRKVKDQVKRDIVYLKNAFKKVYGYEGDLPIGISDKDNKLVLTSAQLLPQHKSVIHEDLQDWLMSLKPASKRKSEMKISNQLLSEGYTETELLYAIGQVKEDRSLKGINNILAYLASGPINKYVNSYREWNAREACKDLIGKSPEVDPDFFDPNKIFKAVQSGARRMDDYQEEFSDRERDWISSKGGFMSLGRDYSSRDLKELLKI